MAHLTPWLQKEFHSSFRRSRIESHQQKVQELNAEITKLNMECQQLRQQALWKGFAGDLGKADGAHCVFLPRYPRCPTQKARGFYEIHWDWCMMRFLILWPTMTPTLRITCSFYGLIMFYNLYNPFYYWFISQFCMAPSSLFAGERVLQGQRSHGGTVEASQKCCSTVVNLRWCVEHQWLWLSIHLQLMLIDNGWYWLNIWFVDESTMIQP